MIIYSLLCLVLICLWRLNFSLQLYSQYLQVKGFSPVWIIKCRFTEWYDAIIFEHCGHDHFPLPNSTGKFWNWKQKKSSLKWSILITAEDSCISKSHGNIVLLLQMTFQTVVSIVSVWTYMTWKWLLSSMNKNVSFHKSMWLLSFRTDGTGPQFFSNFDWNNLQQLKDLKKITNLRNHMVIHSFYVLIWWDFGD